MSFKALLYSFKNKLLIEGHNLYIYHSLQLGPTFVFGQNPEGVRFSLKDSSNINCGVAFSIKNEDFCEDYFRTK